MPAKRPESPGDRVELRLLGPPQVTREGQPVSFDTRKAVALLAYLAVTARPHDRDALVELLWPTAEPTRGRAALRRTLSVASAVGPGLLVERSHVALDPALVVADTAEFERLARSDLPDDRDRAVALARGAFLAGFALRDAPEFDAWQWQTADRLRSDLSRLLGTRVRELVAERRWSEALPRARERVAVDPLSEPAHRALIRLLAQSGDRAAALQQYRTCVRVLADELGVDPLPETRAVYEALRAEQDATWAEERPPAASPASPASLTVPLVGRDGVLDDLLHRWRASTGSAVSVVAEPGMGRTTLLEALASAVARQGGRVVLVRGHQAERGLAFGVATDLLRRLVAAAPDLAGRLTTSDARELGRFVPGLGVGQAPSLDSPGARARLLDTMRRAVGLGLGEGDRPGLLVVDDAHWVDAASMELAGYLARRPPDRTLVVLSSRTGQDPLALETEPVARIRLGPLPPAEVAALLAGLGIEPDDATLGAVMRRTTGVPLLLVEHALALRSADEQAVAAEVGAQVGARLDASPGATRQILAAAAVLGGEADSDLLRATSGRSLDETVDAIDDALARGLLVELRAGDSYDLPHDLLRRIVLDDLSAARLRLLSGRAADATVARHHRDPGEAPAAAVAGHLARAGRSREAADWYAAAAEHARQLWAHQEALEHLTRALDLGYDPVGGGRALGETLTTLGRYREAVDAYERAASRTDDAEQLALLERRLADVRHRLGEWAAARAHLESALEGLAALPPSPALEAATARALADLALVLVRQGELGLAADTAQAALDAGRSAADPTALAQAHDVLGVIALHDADAGLAGHHLAESLVHARTLEDPAAAVAALNNLSRLRATTGDLPGALAAAEEALALGVQHGDRHRLGALHTNLADLQHADGQRETAEVHLRLAAELLADVDRDPERRPEVWKLVSW